MVAGRKQPGRDKRSLESQAGGSSALESMQWLENFNAISDPVFICDTNSRILTANNAFARAFGIPGDRLAGKLCYEVFHRGRRPIRGCPLRQALKSGQPVREEIFEPRLNAFFDISISPVIGAGGEITRLVHIARDITSIKKAAKIKDEFISLVSHELRTPLTVITGSLRSAMSKGISPGDMKELIENAAEGADSLMDMLDNMLELSRYQTGRLQFHSETVRMDILAQRCIMKMEGRGTGQKFNVHFPSDLPPVEADPVRVERILNNLVENAARYSPWGTEIRLAGRLEGDFIVTEVVDRSGGLSPAEQGDLFKLLTQMEKGTGQSLVPNLGLVVARLLVEGQGGWIKVDSKVGSGSTFSFALPAGKWRRRS